MTRVSLEEAVKKDMRTALEAMRDSIAHELEANLCSNCLNSRLRTGDQAALYLRLEKVLEKIAELPEEIDEEVSTYDQLRARRDAKLATPGTPEPEDRPLGTKSAQRRAGSHRTSRNGGPVPGPVATAGPGQDAGDTA